MMAHDKTATLKDARDRGVDVWAPEGVHLICHVTSNCMLEAMRQVMGGPVAFHAASIGGGDYLMAILPQGEARAAARMPELRLLAMNNPVVFQHLLDHAVAAYRERLEQDPENPDTRYELAYMLLLRRDFDAARAFFNGLAGERGHQFQLWVNLAECYEGLSDWAQAREARERAVAAAERNGDLWALPELTEALRPLPSSAR